MKYKTSILIQAALFAALTAIGAFITIPLPYVPITLQLLFCLMSGIILGSKFGMLSQLLYVGLGLLGLPIFAGGQGGFSTILTPSFGYLIGFIFAPLVVGKIHSILGKSNFLTVLFSCSVGVIVVYIFGVPYLYLILKFYVNKPMDIIWVLKNGFLIFLIGDFLKCIVISLISIRILPAIKKQGY
jgi:biotin transport system substrate-specific component